MKNIASMLAHSNAVKCAVTCSLILLCQICGAGAVMQVKGSRVKTRGHADDDLVKGGMAFHNNDVLLAESGFHSSDSSAEAAQPGKGANQSSSKASATAQKPDLANTTTLEPKTSQEPSATTPKPLQAPTAETTRAPPLPAAASTTVAQVITTSLASPVTTPAPRYPCPSNGTVSSVANKFGNCECKKGLSCFDMRIMSMADKLAKEFKEENAKQLRQIAKNEEVDEGPSCAMFEERDDWHALKQKGDATVAVSRTFFSHTCEHCQCQALPPSEDKATPGMLASIGNVWPFSLLKSGCKPWQAASAVLMMTFAMSFN